MVDEGALQDVVDVAQVGLVGHPVPVAADEPDPRAVRLPPVDGTSRPPRG